MSRSRSLAVVAAVGFATMAAVPAVASADSTYPTNTPQCGVVGSAVVSGVTSPNSAVTLTITGGGATQLVSISGSGSADVITPSATTDGSGNASVAEKVSGAGTASFTVTSSASSSPASCTVNVKAAASPSPNNGLASPSIEPAATTPAPATTSGGGSTGGTALPFTGASDILPLTVGGIALIATGVGLVAATRRRVTR